MARPDAWFRFYNTTVDNPKVQRLQPVLFMAWVNLLCLASKRAGKIAYDAVDFALRTKTGIAQAWLRTLTDKGLFDHNEDGTYTPHDWNELQYKQGDSTARVKRHRERKSNDDETTDETVTVTVPEKSIADQIIAEPQKPPRGPVALPKDFIQFWESYPDKVGQKAALKAWKNAKDKPDLLSILAALDRYVRTKPGDRAWCNPATWLNQGRWNDAPASAQALEQTRAQGGRTHDQWRWGVKMWLEKRMWPGSFGPEPGMGGCECPSEILAEFKIGKAA